MSLTGLSLEIYIIARSRYGARRRLPSADPFSRATAEGHFFSAADVNNIGFGP
jgi:hypothetical protein